MVSDRLLQGYHGGTVLHDPAFGNRIGAVGGIASAALMAVPCQTPAPEVRPVCSGTAGHLQLHLCTTGTDRTRRSHLTQYPIGEHGPKKAGAYSSRFSQAGSFGACGLVSCASFVIG